MRVQRRQRPARCSCRARRTDRGLALQFQGAIVILAETIRCRQYPAVEALAAMRGYANDSDADLMVYMSMKADDPSAAREAWGELYARHSGYLYAVCQRAYGDLLGGDTAVGDLVADTFRRAFERSHQFVPPEGVDSEALRRVVRAWLGRIAQRLFQDLLRSRRRLDVVHVDAEAWEAVPAPEPQPTPSAARVERVCQAFGHLSEREQLVLRATLQWYQPGRLQQRLPSDVVEDLAATLQTTPENLRQIRRRSLEKIRALLASPDELPGSADGAAEDQP